MPTLRDWSERRILDAMRAWRRGCGPLEPWFRATPFAAANHYRNRSLAISCPAEPPIARRLAATLPRPDRQSLWIFDLPGPLGLWLTWELRRHRRLSAALAWNGWYDPRGLLDGRAEIALLLTLGRRLGRLPADSGSYLLFDSRRHSALTDEAAKARVLDNRYTLNEEDAPSVEQLRALGIRHVRAWSWRETAEDMKAYLDYLGRELRVTVTDGLARELGAHG
jgi:hypothetical protein